MPGLTSADLCIPIAFCVPIMSADEEIPWSASRLIVGTGARGQLPIMPEVYQEAQRRGLEVVTVPTKEACRLLSEVGPPEASAVIHVTC